MILGVKHDFGEFCLYVGRGTGKGGFSGKMFASGERLFWLLRELVGKFVRIGRVVLKS